MIKQDYLIRMIQEIISLIVNMILNKRSFVRMNGQSTTVLHDRF